MIQHIPWVGPSYEKDGIGSQRICIVGNSHWLSKEDKDADSFTIGVVSDVIDGKQNISFFNQIRSYFDFPDHKALWNRVIFLNYIPECVGGPDERYQRGTKDQIKRAKERFLNLIREKHPDKVLVFSSVAWSRLPATREEEATGKGALGLDPKKFSGFSWGTYDANGHIVMAFGLRHPQGADRVRMRQAVRHILDMPLEKKAAD